MVESFQNINWKMGDLYLFSLFWAFWSPIMTSQRGSDQVKIDQSLSFDILYTFAKFRWNWFEISRFRPKKSHFDSLLWRHKGVKRGSMLDKKHQNLCFNILNTFAKFHWNWFKDDRFRLEKVIFMGGGVIMGKPWSSMMFKNTFSNMAGDRSFFELGQKTAVILLSRSNRIT